MRLVVSRMRWSWRKRRKKRMSLIKSVMTMNLLEVITVSSLASLPLSARLVLSFVNTITLKSLFADSRE
uniref:Uncharacterized protein n=1 Tax=Anguilla anguilla TaxID=7936 RepID=A0A0E9V8Y1_ANGAN